MTLKNETELAHARVRLKEFQDRYDQLRADQTEDAQIKRVTLWSLKKQINQLIEDITRYESRLHQL